MPPVRAAPPLRPVNNRRGKPRVATAPWSQRVGENGLRAR
jgi:hypothetical protein